MPLRVVLTNGTEPFAGVPGGEFDTPRIDFVDRYLDDGRLDQHLQAPHVELADRGQQFVRGAGIRPDDERVQGFVRLNARDRRIVTAALGEVIEQFRDFGGVGVVQIEDLGGAGVGFRDIELIDQPQGFGDRTCLAAHH